MAQRRKALIGLVLACALMGDRAMASEWLDGVIDAGDGKIDLSEWLLDRKGFLPVPIVITEPAVGYGGGIGLMFINGTLRDAARKSQEGGHVVPPDIYGLAAFATENGTKGVAAGGQWTFLDDRFRYRGGLGDFSVNLDYYGAGGQSPFPIQQIGYNLKGFASFQQGMVRLGDSDTFMGVRWIYLDLATRLDIDADSAGLTSRELARRNSGLGVALEHDSRDNVFTPNAGWVGAAEATFYSQRIGSDNDFKAYRAHVFSYLRLHPDWTLGLRADGRAARGEVPLYMLPYVELRGIPAVRLQDTNVGVLEAEARFDTDPRWALVGFAGTGRAWGTRTNFAGADKAVAGGLGFRYLIARRLGLYVGMDFARSSLDEAFYIQVGSAWR
jgi:hypothetical protein